MERHSGGSRRGCRYQAIIIGTASFMISEGWKRMTPRSSQRLVLRPVPKNQVAISSSTPRLYSQGVQIRRMCGGTWLSISMATSPAPRRTACR